MVAVTQTFLTNSEDEAFMCGISHTNQRVESWWSFLRKNRTFFMYIFFRELVDEISRVLILTTLDFTFGPRADYFLAFLKILIIQPRPPWRRSIPAF